MRNMDYFPHAGRLDKACHPSTGDVATGDRVREKGSNKMAGVILYLSRGNQGRGRPFACVQWAGGFTTMIPLGRLVKD